MKNKVVSRSSGEVQRGLLCALVMSSCCLHEQDSVFDDILGWASCALEAISPGIRGRRRSAERRGKQGSEKSS